MENLNYREKQNASLFTYTSTPTPPTSTLHHQPRFSMIDFTTVTFIYAATTTTVRDATILAG
eukprot:3883838-Amphidinium_carterae.2